LVLFILCGIVIVSFQNEWGKRFALKFLTGALHQSNYTVTIGEIQTAFPHAIVLKAITIESPEFQISAETVKVKLSLFSLLKKNWY